jgi:hypothetical protein
MSSKSKLVSVVLVIVAIVVIALIVFSGPKSDNSPAGGDEQNSSSTVPVVSETKKISGTISEYQNAELGFSLKYPSGWEKEEGNAGVNFIVPIDTTQVSTVATLQVSVQVVSGTCAFPPVTTIKERSTVKSGSNSFSMISMSNTVQGRTYFNRMYSLQKGDVCYVFSFASIAQNPSTKGLTGSNITQAQNNNKAIVNATDASFTEMVKSFAFVTGPSGVDETVAPKK